MFGPRWEGWIDRHARRVVAQAGYRLTMAGMRDIIDGRRILVRHLRDTVCLDDVGPWVPEGRGDAVNDV